MMYRSLFAFFLAAAALSACKGPCDELRDRICDCGANDNLKEACQDRSRKTLDTKVTASDEAICEDLLETCSCIALEEGQLSACGLATQSKTP